MDQLEDIIKNTKLDASNITAINEQFLPGITLRNYQVNGINWIGRCYSRKQGCILADEMGLGKTCQTIGFLKQIEGIHFILSPLSVLDNWKKELRKFCPSNFRIFYFVGDKEKRKELKSSFKSSNYRIVLSTYEICLKEEEFLQRINFQAMVIDEAHRLKNKESLLHKMLLNFSCFRLLLTGTPIQNNLNELYNLLSFCNPKIFRQHFAEQFVAEAVHDKSRLKNIMEPFMLRRTKGEVSLGIPPKLETVLYHGLTGTQKKLYKGILRKDPTAFQSNSKVNLMNILMQLRKVVAHPYLFDGVEPEPFEIGEHIVDVSGKLFLLDALLKRLHNEGHKVLVFSQMTRVLDILQDYLGFRGYSYERLDGSIRGEERYCAIKNFEEEDDVFVFLLSTKAGGVGLNLISADTVVLFDSDFNPQNDAQAMARVHRIGQVRPVRVFRLIGKSTVEELMLARAERKLKLTEEVSGSDEDVGDVLKFGLNKLFSDDELYRMTDEELDGILGESKDGRWILDEESGKHNRKDENSEETKESIYVFEGYDYSKDGAILDELLKDSNKQNKEKAELSKRNSVRALRYGIDDLEKIKPIRKKLTKEERKIRQQQRLEELWRKNNYQSVSETLDDSSSDEEFEEDLNTINYTVGDVTKPVMGKSDRGSIIVQCVDINGKWGSGGVFSALDTLSKGIGEQYEFSERMKDLFLGDTHIIKLNNKLYVGLVACQDKKRQVKMDSLELCLKKIKQGSQRLNCSVHLPRIGFGTPSFNWYGAERIIRKILTNKGVETWIYYFKRRKRYIRQSSSDGDGATADKKRKPNLDLSKFCIYFYNIDEKRRSELTKRLIRLNADIHSSLEDSTSHVIVDKYDEDNLNELLDGFDECVVVKINWLQQCLEKNEIVKLSDDYKVR
ncbi:DgyrCDS8590 [Dimorphilus gyrociliatus]|uniref:DgyrCDS8590 n=1 Tax=Dimorphilus gyrociliatus TaxID=2664684 RepID=A0A7I8VVM2_9ANNE|nr:DgyrCDS8590 [Dimorphilus gyrociliatus]